jgi:hypothetical protein
VFLLLMDPENAAFQVAPGLQLQAKWPRPFAGAAGEMHPSLEQAVKDAIEEHLSVYPQAADSAAGVARWWLPASGPVATAAEVEHVLTGMVRSHSLRCVRLADGTVLYSKCRNGLH